MLTFAKYRDVQETIASSNHIFFRIKATEIQTWNHSSLATNRDNIKCSLIENCKQNQIIQHESEFHNLIQKFWNSTKILFRTFQFFVAVAILALACSASASFIRSFSIPASYSSPLSYYYHPSIRAIQTPVVRNVQFDAPLETQTAWHQSIPASVVYSSPIVKSPETIWTESTQGQSSVVYSAPVVSAPKTSLLKGRPAPIAYHSLPEVTYAYTPTVHQNVVIARPEAWVFL